MNEVTFTVWRGKPQKTEEPSGRRRPPALGSEVVRAVERAYEMETGEGFR